MIDVTPYPQNLTAKWKHHVLTCRRDAMKRGTRQVFISIRFFVLFPFFPLLHLLNSLDLNKLSIHPIALHQGHI